ncbi:antitoxin Xre-like helix-turn-helix domain-containing protein [Hymenobacter rubripertinctus]|uniref:antitoxin Xre-like helix-turn-helix domain-containing protein n=1 Tax=Hymenobacter rubripertinctus TaxID=2029981 RepID=UPI0016040463|nr:helix-turn-helix domain-containing protein [Hymenobacter rubripertinctus]
MRKFSRHRAPSPHLSLLQAIQAHLGLTQAQVADLLDVSRATLSQDGRLTDTGMVRRVPSAAMLRLLALQQLLPAPHGPAPLPPPRPPAPLLAEERETLELRRQKIDLEKYPLEKALARCQTRLAQAQLRQQALPALQAALGPDDEQLGLLLDMLIRRADFTLDADDSTRQLLELRLRVLAFEAAEIARLLAD